MINYKFGEIEEKIEWDDFLSLTYKDKLTYKSDYKTFSDLYEFICKNIKDITKLLFDGYEYILQDGLLHNLYGPATLKHIKDGFMPGTRRRYYINGKLVFAKEKPFRYDKVCNKVEDFEKEIVFLEWITKKIERGKTYKEDINYILHPINLEELRIQDKRYNKLNRILKNTKNEREN